MKRNHLSSSASRYILSGFTRDTFRRKQVGSQKYAASQGIIVSWKVCLLLLLLVGLSLVSPGVSSASEGSNSAKSRSADTTPTLSDSLRKSTLSDSLRIRIFDLYHPKSIRIWSKDTLEIVSGSLTQHTIQMGDVLQLTRSGNKSRTVDLQSSPTSETRSIPKTASASWSITSTGNRAISISVNDRDLVRTYTGRIEVRVDSKNGSGLVIINTVPVEDYVAAVVATEYGLNDVEGSRAMAVLARTYALRSKADSDADYDHVDHSMSQVFHGVGSISMGSSDAAYATRGLILVQDGLLVESVYHSSSGGHTANNEDVWNGSPVEYLRGRKDKYDDSPHLGWQTSVDRSRLLNVVSKHFGTKVTGITVESRSADGRVQSVRLHSNRGDKFVPANEFRLVFRREFGVMSLKSTLFRVRRRGDKYVFSGDGFGHGVGLSQWGAHNMAKAGKKYEEILTYYYKGVDIVSIEGISNSSRMPFRDVDQDSAAVRISLPVPGTVHPGSQ